MVWRAKRQISVGAGLEAEFGQSTRNKNAYVTPHQLMEARSRQR